MILPKPHHVSQLIVRHRHMSAPYGGREQKLSELKRVFRIISARSLSRRLLGTALSAEE